MSTHRKVVIVGSGPAGLTAAIYAARGNLQPIVIEGIAAGGQLMLTTDVENFPGFPDGIIGPELMSKFREQAARFGAEFVTADADRVDVSERAVRRLGRQHRVPRRRRSSSPPARRRACSGSRPRSALLGHGVSTCATCDGFFFRDKPLAIVGGGDSAMEEAHVPHEVRDQGHGHAPARRAARLEDHAGARVRERQDRVPVEHGRRRRHRQRQGRGARAARHPSPGRSRSSRSTVSSSPSATTRTRTSSRASSTSTTTATSSPRPTPPRPRSRACSPPATCRTTSTARRSPRPAAAAWPRWRPSAGLEALAHAAAERS